jgi:hypothetical protein
MMRFTAMQVLSCFHAHPHLLPERLSIFSSGRPSRRRQKKAAPQGERLSCCSQKTVSAHPEEVPYFGTVSKGVAPVYRPAPEGEGTYH